VAKLDLLNLRSDKRIATRRRTRKQCEPFQGQLHKGNSKIAFLEPKLELFVERKELL
jgi:hypothetical protein